MQSKLKNTNNENHSCHRFQRSQQNEAAMLSQKLASFKPQEKIQQAKTNLLYKQEALAKQMMLLVEKKREQYSLNVAKLDQLSPLLRSHPKYQAKKLIFSSN